MSVSRIICIEEYPNIKVKVSLDLLEPTTSPGSLRSSQTSDMQLLERNNWRVGAGERNWRSSNQRIPLGKKSQDEREGRFLASLGMTIPPSSSPPSPDQPPAWDCSSCIHLSFSLPLLRKTSFSFTFFVKNNRFCFSKIPPWTKNNLIQLKTSIVPVA